MMRSQSHLPTLGKLEKPPHAIDFVGTGTYQVGQLDILQIRSVELNRTVESNLSARGLHHRSLDFFTKGVKSSTTEIQRTVLQGVRDPKSKGSNHHLKSEYFQRALGFERLGQIDKAIEDYSRCISMDNKCAPAYFNRGGLLNTQGKLDQAIADISKAVAIQPANKTYLTNRSLLYRRKGLFEEATNDMVMLKSLEVVDPSGGNELKSSASTAMLSPMSTPVRASSRKSASPSMRRQGSRKLLAPKDGNSAGKSRKTLRKRGASAEDIEEDLEQAIEYVAPAPKSNDPMINYLKKSYIDREDSTAELRSVIEFLKSVKFFSGIAADPVVMKTVADKVKLCTYAKGDYIFKEGDIGKSFFIVADGEISVVKCLSGKTIVTVFLTTM